MANDWQTDPSGYLSSAIGAPVTITSGYRTPQQNASVGGVPNSAHLNAQAFDFVPKGMNLADATANLVKSGVPFDQIYNEGDHVHVSFAPTMRRQVIPPKGQMDQSQGPSDADLIAALTGKTPAATAAAAPGTGPAFMAPHAGWRSNGTNVEWYDPTGQTTGPPDQGPAPQQTGPSDQELLHALTAGASPAKGAPKPAAPDAVSVPAPGTSPIPFGLSGEVMAHIPFAKDAAAGVPALLDYAADKISGTGPTLSDLVAGKDNSLAGKYHANIAALNAQQAQYEVENPALSNVGAGLGYAVSGGPARGAVVSAVQEGLPALMRGGAKAGATLGGLFGLGTPTGENDSLAARAGNALTGAGTGAALGAAIPVLGAGVSAGARYAGTVTNKLFPPIETQAADRARGIIDSFAGEPQAGPPNLKQLVPGSVPTMAEATGNPGVAALQRAMRDLNPNSPLVARETQNAAARAAATEKTVGTNADIEAAKEARNETAGPMREAAFENATDTDVKNVKNAINRVLSSPAGQRDVVASSLSKIRDKLELDYPLSERVGDASGPLKQAIASGTLGDAKLADFTEARRLLSSANRGFTSEEDLVKGLRQLAKKQKIVGPIDNALKIVKSGGIKLQSDPAQLYGIRQSVTDMLSPMAHGTGSDARLASSELLDITKSLDDAIEKGAPGYKDYMAKFAEMSKPANAMEFLQSLNLTDSKGNVTLGKVTNALTKLERDSNKSGVQNSKAVTDAQRQMLHNLHADLLRSQNISLGKSIGSNTVQNAMAQQRLGLARRILPEGLGTTLGAGAGGLLAGPHGAEFGGMIGDRVGAHIGATLNSRSAQVQNLLQSHIEDMLLNPGKYHAPPSASVVPTITDMLNGSRARATMGIANRLAIMHQLARPQTAQ